MIPRILVPLNLPKATRELSSNHARPISSLLDARMVVPRDLPVIPLDGKTSIPAHVPLEVLSARTLVPRDTPVKRLEKVLDLPEHLPLSVLDSRIVVPRDAAPLAAGAEKIPQRSAAPLPPGLAEVLEPDVLTTGEVNLMTRPIDERADAWRSVSRTASALVHAAIIVLAFFSPKLFPPHQPTQAEVELARKQLNFIYLPPSVNDVPKVAPRPSPPSAKIRIDPGILHKIAPKEPEPEPGPPERPAAPVTPPNAPPPPVAQASPLPAAPALAKPQPKMSAQAMPPAIQPRSSQTPHSLTLPSVSPGTALQRSVQSALQGGGGQSRGFADPIPPSPAPGGGANGGGGSPRGYLGGNMEVLTPTDGIDFTNYFARMLASVKRNWYAIIPESARLGDRGRVIITFKINQDGGVPFPDPLLERTSGKEPLDRAAMAAIRASSPFEPLPSAFTRPYIELRFTFLYNLPLNYQ